MKQVAQRPRDGSIQVREVPAPILTPGHVLVENRFSLISAGTERSRVQFGEKNLLAKARSRPDLVRKVVDRARAEGVRAAASSARERLETSAALGYSSAGVVVAVDDAEGLAPGDLVACAGGGYANHGEVISVPRNLVARLPAGVSLESAAYATVGAIALHGIRQAEASVGDRVGVIGLGLVGQLAVRLLVAAGCTAVGIDLDPVAIALAESAGAVAVGRNAQDLTARVSEVTSGRGLDAVLICAAARTSDPLELAASLARDRGRLVVVGDVLVSANRELLYEKELEIRLSRSYGPGRYDREYEEHGHDYPVGYVRWTEQRNLEAFLDLVASGRLDPSALTTHRFAIEDAAAAYDALSGTDGERPFGIVLEYEPGSSSRAVAAPPRATRTTAAAPRVALVGAGAYARGVLLPALKAAGAELAVVASERGLSAADAAGRFGFERTAADVDEILDDATVDAVVIATRHSSHADLTARALAAGKHVLVEKPLALGAEELDAVERALAGSEGVLMVGFNRRFAPLAELLRAEIGETTDLALSARVNAGPLPGDHWLHDAEEGGGRLLGEGCHFVDLLAFLAGSEAVSVHAQAVAQAGRPLERSDTIVATLRFAEGQIGTLLYSGGGDPRFPKERVEAFGGGLAAALDDFRRLELVRGGRRQVHKGRQDKGHRAEVARFLDAVAGRAAAPDARTYLASSRATIALAESLRSGMPVSLS